jgi:2-(1,2-epoxy-1,2-dihydrophenyl)acetyl-CoA isomerase
VSGLLVESGSGIRTLTLNRPERLNALDTALFEALTDALEQAATDEGVRVLVLTGAGKAFCAGGDLATMEDGAGDLESGMRKQRASVLLREMPKATIAAVNGPASGAGMSLALACDFRIMTHEARFVPGYAAVGLSGDFGASYVLPRLIGPERALRMFLLNEVVSAGQAMALGLVSQVVAGDELDAAVSDLADRLASCSPDATARTKATFRAAERASLLDVLELEARGMIDLAGTDEFHRRLAAFLDRGSARR